MFLPWRGGDLKHAVRHCLIPRMQLGQFQSFWVYVPEVTPVCTVLAQGCRRVVEGAFVLSIAEERTLLWCVVGLFSLTSAVAVSWVQSATEMWYADHISDDASGLLTACVRVFVHIASSWCRMHLMRPLSFAVSRRSVECRYNPCSARAESFSVCISVGSIPCLAAVSSCIYGGDSCGYLVCGVMYRVCFLRLGPVSPDRRLLFCRTSRAARYGTIRATLHDH